MNGEYTENMTILTRQAFEAASARNLDARSAKELLLSTPVRTFPEVIGRLAPDRANRKHIVGEMLINDPARKEDSMNRKVNNWLRGVNAPTAREDLLELCFILGLSMQDSDTLLATVGEQGFHWRDPHELILAYALRQRMTYLEAKELKKRILADMTWTDDKDMTESYTHIIASRLAQVGSEEELKQLLQDSADQLGTRHNNAFQYFQHMIEVLEAPMSLVGKEKDYPVTEVLKIYMDRRSTERVNQRNTDQKRYEILSKWPDNTMISEVKSRNEDVSRKLLLLLFLATDGGEEISEEYDEDDYDYEEEEEGNEADEAFRSSYIRMNQMLANCGYRTLDPRNPMDWIAIYCMRISDDPEDMRGLDERLAEMMAVLFESETPAAEA